MYQFYYCSSIIDNCADSIRLQFVLSVLTYASVFESLAVRQDTVAFTLRRSLTAHYHPSNYHRSFWMRTPPLLVIDLRLEYCSLPIGSTCSRRIFRNNCHCYKRHSIIRSMTCTTYLVSCANRTNYLIDHLANLVLLLVGGFLPSLTHCNNCLHNKC